MQKISELFPHMTQTHQPNTQSFSKVEPPQKKVVSRNHAYKGSLTENVQKQLQKINQPSPKNSTQASSLPQTNSPERTTYGSLPQNK
jgi:hypothetical protein